MKKLIFELDLPSEKLIDNDPTFRTRMFVEMLGLNFEIGNNIKPETSNYFNTITIKLDENKIKFKKNIIKKNSDNNLPKTLDKKLYLIFK